MTNPSEEHLTKGQQVIGIFQETRQVLRSSLLYASGESMPDMQDPEVQSADEAIAEFNAHDLGVLIAKKAAAYYPRHDAQQLLNIMISRYIALQNETAAGLLTPGPVIVRGFKDDSFAIADLSEKEPEIVESPAIGSFQEVSVELGWFSLLAEQKRTSIPATVVPLDFQGEAQVRIDIAS